MCCFELEKVGAPASFKSQRAAFLFAGRLELLNHFEGYAGMGEGDHVEALLLCQCQERFIASEGCRIDVLLDWLASPHAE